MAILSSLCGDSGVANCLLSKFYTSTEGFSFYSREIVVASPVEDYFLYIDDLPPAAKVLFSIYLLLFPYSKIAIKDW